jgi:hypothetical protein
MRPLTERDRAIGRSGASPSPLRDVLVDPENRHAPRDGQGLAAYSGDRMAPRFRYIITPYLVDPFRTVNRLIPPNLP